MNQTIVRENIRPAVAGMIADLAFADVISRMVDVNVAQVETLTVGTPTIAVAQINTFTIDTAANGNVFSITINGVVVATGTSSGTDKTVQRDAIEVLLLANAYFAANFDYADSGADAFTVTAKVAGLPFDMTETVAATSAYSFAVTTANIIGSQFNFTIDGHQVIYPAASTNITTERDALLVVLQADATYAQLVTFASVSTDQISITALTAGVPYTLVFSNTNAKLEAGAGTQAVAVTASNVTGDPIAFGLGLSNGSANNRTQLPSATSFIFQGVAARDQREQTLITGIAQYVAGDAVSVLRKGRIWVPTEEAVTPADSVFLRHTINGALTVGGWRTDADTARADDVSTFCSWLDYDSANGLALLDINLP